jgi:hypothetical protein
MMRVVSKATAKAKKAAKAPKTAAKKRVSAAAAKKKVSAAGAKKKVSAAAPKARTSKRAAKPGAGAAKKAARPMAAARRADFGTPIDGFFAKQPPQLRPILEALRALVAEIAPGATASIKWGMPFYSIDGKPLCALAGFKSHVNLILAGPPDAFADPEGLLDGGGKTGRHLKVRSLDDLPRESVREWIRAAARVHAVHEA